MEHHGIMTKNLKQESTIPMRNGRGQLSKRKCFTPFLLVVVIPLVLLWIVNVQVIVSNGARSILLGGKGMIQSQDWKAPATSRKDEQEEQTNFAKDAKAGLTQNDLQSPGLFIQQDVSWTGASNDDNINNGTTAASVATALSSSPNMTSTVILPIVPEEFIPQPGVVLVTKLHGIPQLKLLEQSLCLLTQAYNGRLKYPIVVFTTEFLNDTILEPIYRVVEGDGVSLLTVVQDNPGLHTMIQQLNPTRKRLFLERCQVRDITDPASSMTTNSNWPLYTTNLTWWSDCGDGRLAYNWQAEFRSWHLWNHPALQNYQTMMWFDTDLFSTRHWTRDPVGIHRHYDLVILYSQFPGGFVRNHATEIQKRIFGAFKTNVCRISIDKTTGAFQVTTSANTNENDCQNQRFGQIGGYFHVTDLDFYRNYTETWSRVFIGADFLTRALDDQVAVTIPAALVAPSKAWDMNTLGLRLGNYHNFYLDGGRTRTTNFKKYWKKQMVGSPFKDHCQIYHGA